MTRSVEGISPVFLLQWTLGDVTNLIGSVLTKQLFIQIVIAAYMLMVDLCLCAQYFGAFPRSHPAYHKATPPTRTGTYVTERSPLLVTRYRRGLDHPNRSYSINTRSSRSSRHRVAAPASKSRPELVRAKSSDAYITPTSRGKGKQNARRSKTVDRSHPRRANMIDSLEDVSGPSDMESTTESLARGRRRERLLVPLTEAAMMTNGALDMQHDGHAVAPANHLRRHRFLAPRPGTTRRGSSMVLLGIGALFAFARLPGPDTDLVPNTMRTTALGLHPLANSSATLHDTSLLAAPRHPFLLYMPTHDSKPDRTERRRPPLAFGQLVGRVLAWLCTLLYMTSRMPQIWTNFQRRSVKGLSLLLFISAFMANLLYSVSILSNPKAVGPERRAFLMESLPFLLGSAGTLVFDLVIIVQWFMWHKRS